MGTIIRRIHKLKFKFNAPIYKRRKYPKTSKPASTVPRRWSSWF